MNHDVVRSSGARQKSTLVHWEFTRGHQRLSCQIDRESAGSGAFAVAVVPYGSVQKSYVESFTNAAAALCRHADVASRLRETGWKLASYTM